MLQFLVGFAFFSGFLAVFGINLALGDFMESQRRKVREQLAQETRRRRHEETGNLAGQAGEEVDMDMAEGEETRSLRQRLAAFIDQSGTNLTVKRLLILSALSGITLGCVAALLAWQPMIGVTVAPLGILAPLGYVSMKRQKRITALRSQLPDAFDLISRTMRAGQTITESLKMVADEFAAPVADEFSYCYHQQNLGMSPEVALRNMAQRTGIFEMRVFVLAVVVHRETGGNLTHLLEKLATLIRERYRIRGVIQALTAEGRLQALILLALPPIMFFVMLILNRSYAVTLFDYPWLIFATLISMCIGALWMQRIVRPEY